MIRQCDIDLTSRLDSLTGLPKPGMDEEVADTVREDVWPEVFKDPATRDYEKYDWSESLNQTVASEMARRFGVPGKIKGGVPYPGAFLTERLIEILGDLVRTKHPCLVLKSKYRPAAPTQPTEAENFEALKEQVRADLDDPYISSVEINQKKRDPNYKRAFDAVQTDAVNKGYGVDSNAVAKAEAPAEVRQFAHLLNEHIREYGVPKARAGYFTLQVGGKKYEYGFQQFQGLMDQAAAFDLVR